MPFTEALIRTPIGYNMSVLAERLQHLLPVIDLNSWRNILDIGAMDGWEGVNLAKVFPDATIHAFEPSRANCERCIKTYMLQPAHIRSRIGLSQIALNDTTSTIEFYAVDEEKAAAVKGKVNTGMGSLLQLENPDMWPWEHNAQISTTVQGYRLDDWCRETNTETVDAIWMDVQGAELKVLRGAENTLANIQVIMTEAGVKPYYHGHTLKPDIDQYLASKGFVELESAREQAHEYEINAIYVNTKFMKQN